MRMVDQTIKRAIFAGDCMIKEGGREGGSEWGREGMWRIDCAGEHADPTPIFTPEDMP